MDNRLEKKYGLPTAVCMVVGIVIGSGVFFKAEAVLTATGGDLVLGVLAWAAAGCVMLSCAAAFALLAVRRPDAGGPADYAREAAGPGYAYCVGWFLAAVYYPSMTAVLAWASARYACLLLGADSAFACDIDEKAVGVAYENAALNGVDRARYTVRAGDVVLDEKLRREMGSGYDIVVANIVADVIIALAPTAGRLMAPHGVFICSGIIDDRSEEVRSKLEEAGFTIQEANASEGWYSFVCRRADRQ